MSGRRLRRAFLAAAISMGFLGGCAGGAQEVEFAPLPEASEPAMTPASEVAGPFPVVDVVDGDTAKVDVGGEVVTVRVIGLDTPEVHHPSKPVQCFGREASGRAADLLSGRRVELEADPSQSETDRYGRLLRHVWVEDVNFALVMINDGYAHEYTYRTPHEYRDEYRAAQADAEAAGRGLWSPETCDGNTDEPAG